MIQPTGIGQPVRQQTCRLSPKNCDTVLPSSQLQWLPKSASAARVPRVPRLVRILFDGVPGRIILTRDSGSPSLPASNELIRCCAQKRRFEHWMMLIRPPD